ncbi:MAG: 30S ribosomal protein S2 [Patescibacteria group bacterium]
MLQSAQDSIKNESEAAPEGGSFGSISKEMEEMSRAGVYFGYSKSRRHPKMTPFIFGIRNNVEIFDIVKVKEQLEKAADFMKALGKEDKTILFVGTKPPVKEIIRRTADSLRMPYVAERWLGGTLTNFKVLKKRTEYFLDLQQKKSSPDFDKLPKRERFKIIKFLAKMEKNFKGLELLSALPQALVVVDTKEESTAIREAKRMSIPVTGILNSDCDPSGIDYLIPANDSSVSSVGYLMDKLAEAYKMGNEKLVTSKE